MPISKQTHKQTNNNNSIQFNSYLFTCKLNSTEANYKVSTSNKKKTKYKTRKFTQ
jgi:hypothetical protein